MLKLLTKFFVGCVGKSQKWMMCSTKMPVTMIILSLHTIQPRTNHHMLGNNNGDNDVTSMMHDVAPAQAQ